MGELFDAAKQETINNLRRNLYDATHAEYISVTDVHDACRAIKQYLPDDFQANFYETAVGNNVKQIAKAIRRIDVEKNIDDIDGIIQFLIGSLESEYHLEVSNLIAKAYETRDPLKFEYYNTLISTEAIKVDMGVYETRIPRDVFIAYSSKDMHLVEELVEVLEAQKFKCFVASRNLRHGKGAVENYNQALEEAMDNCKSFVFISSENSRSLTCDALKVELAYIKRKDVEHAPAEFKNDYSAIPARYKKPRVEYRIGTNEDKTAADSVTRDFFNGYERVYTPDEVAQRVMMQMINTPHADAVPQAQYVNMEQKKICVSCGAENSVNMKFCGECGKNEFVNSVSELIKYQKRQEEAENAKREAESEKTKNDALAEAERAKKEALAEAKKAKKAAEEMAAKAAAAEQARLAAEAKAGAEAKKNAEKKKADTSAYSTSSYSSSSYPTSSKPKKKMSAGLIAFLVLVGIALVITIIGTVSNSDSGSGSGGNNSKIESEEQTSNSGGGNNNSQSSQNKNQYPNLSFTEVSGGWSVSANANKIANITGELVIPSVIDGKNVVQVAENGFKGCAGVTSITVPDTVTYIGQGAFNGCSSLREITVPFVGSSAHANGSEVTFGFIFGTTEYTSSIETWQEYDTSHYRDSIRYFIPSQLTKVTVTAATQLGHGAFHNCTGISEINLNDGITVISCYSFYNCTSLETVSLPNITSISENAFFNCSSMTSFVIGEKVTTIGENAFYNCSMLSKVNSEENGHFVIPENVKTINASAFSGCGSATHITLPFVGKTANASGSEAHFGYIFGRNDSFSLGKEVWQKYGMGNNDISLYTLPSKLTHVTVTAATQLGFGAFSQCEHITEINLNDDISYIGGAAFYGCNQITEINVSGATTIEEALFYNCSSLERLSFSDDVSYIRNNAFFGCANLSSINSKDAGVFYIGNNVKEIGDNVFNGCIKVKTLIIPFTGNKQTASGSGAHFGRIFGRPQYTGSIETWQKHGYNSSENYYVPVSLKQVIITNANGISEYAFQNCTGLVSITINPEAEIAVAANAFDNCSASIVYESYVPKDDAESEDETDSDTIEESSSADESSEETVITSPEECDTETAETSPEVVLSRFTFILLDAETNEPVSGIAVLMRRDNANGSMVSEGTTDENGKVVFEIEATAYYYYAVFVNSQNRGSSYQLDENDTVVGYYY